MNRETPAHGDPLVFPYVRHNLGGGYDASSGVFEAPRAGVYIFLATLQGDAVQADIDMVWVALYQDTNLVQAGITEAHSEG